MKKNIILYLILILLFVGIVNFGSNVVLGKTMIKNKNYEIDATEFNAAKAYSINKTNIVVNIDSKQLKSSTSGIYMNDKMSLMIPADRLREAFECAVGMYDSGELLIENGDDYIKIDTGDSSCVIDSKPVLNVGFELKDGKICIPVSIICDTFGYKYKFNIEENQATIVSNDPDRRTVPYSYNYENIGRAPKVSNQGNLGTCWAFASLTAVSSTLLPTEKLIFSVDHMTLNNSFNYTQDEGGEASMAMAYLLAWQGPVLESQDPYGDGKTDSTLKPVKHVQEVQTIESKDLENIKKMVFNYGRVQSSFYASILNNNKETKYYNKKTNAYCYVGDEKPNHDIVIIGWDDNYPKSNFNINVEGDGAFLCRNSWGDNFGNNGDFYISYYDTNIGVHNVAYTKVENVDNYENIYQSDLCGCMGKLGYDEEYAYFANVYTPGNDESLKAVGFYATGPDTEYSIYICQNFTGVSSLAKRNDPVKTGQLKNSGFYTINLDNEVKLKKDEKFAIIVRIKTPNSKRPVAVECGYDESDSSVIIDDGEGYVSLKGINWDNTEKDHNCNVCLKAYTNNAN